MTRRLVCWGTTAVAVAGLGSFGGWILSLPPAPASGGAPAIDSREAEALVAALKPPKRRSRTYRSRAVTFSGSAAAVESRHGIPIIPDRASDDWPAERVLPAVDGRRPAEALDAALAAVGARYGDRTAGIVAMQLEYPRRNAP